MTDSQRLQHHVSGAIARGEAKPIVGQPAKPNAWRIERNHKMQFCVVRDTPAGHEYVSSASGKPSSFKTFEGALKARTKADRT